MDWLAPLISGAIGVGGTLFGVRTKANQDSKTWVRDKRATAYRAYIEVLQAVQYVVDYDDEINFRLGNEAQGRLDEARDGLSRVTADFELYASDELKSASQELYRAFNEWELADLGPMREEDMEPDMLSMVRAEGWSPMQRMSPLNDGYPWARIRSKGQEVLRLTGNLREQIREELLR